MGMFTRVNKERFCCPVGFCEEFIAVFKLKRYMKLSTNLTANSKFSKFHSFYAIDVKILTDFADWTVENGHQRRICCALAFYEEIIAVFKLKNFKLKPKMTKNPKFSNFQSFYAVFVKFMTDFFEWNVKKGQQGKKL